MAYQIDLLAIAEEELDDALDWYSNKSNKTVQKFYNEYITLRKRLEENPLLYPELEKPIRRARFKKTFPYSAFFYIKQEKVIIVSIFHDKRNPQIWKDRV